MKRINVSLIIVGTIITSFSCTNPNQEKKHISHETHKEHTTDDASCMKPVSTEDSIKYTSKEIAIKGEVEYPLVLTVDSLKAMNYVTINNFEVICQSGAKMKEDKTCKGVLLKDILDKAKLKQTGHKDRGFYIVARASDNYKAVFSWGEIYNNPTGNEVYVLFEENNKPIVRQGSMILITKNDIKTGPRHVYWLQSIEVAKVE